MPAKRSRIQTDVAASKLMLRTVALSQLLPAPYNPRIELKPGDPVFEQLKRSIENFGIVEPIVWNKRTRHVVGGHQRLSVLQALGHTHAEVAVVDLTPEREKTLNLALNKIQGGWDEHKLALLLQDLGQTPDLDVSLTGFQDREITELLARANIGTLSAGDDNAFDQNAALDTNHPAVTRPGELLVLGQHRLLCGDSTKTEDVARVMNGERAILFATDPPYMVGYDGTNHPPSRSGGKKNKNWSGTYGVTWDDAEANPEFYDKFIGAAVAAAIAPRAAWYMWHASRRQAMVEAAWQKHGAFVHCQIIWTKNRPVLTRTWYGWQHEPCFFGWIQGKKPPRTASSVLSTVWPIDTIPNGEQRPDHPTPKPLQVFETPILQHTRAGEICYEPFMGSGTQLIAAQKLGRRCFGLEISPHYCDVIVRRWINLVGAAGTPKALAKRYAKAGKKVAA